MTKTTFRMVATIKKFSTQASKGGSIILTLEMPLTDENSLLASTQNKDCAIDLRFDNQSVETAQGQAELDFEGTRHGDLVKKGADVGFEYIDPEEDLINEDIEEESEYNVNINNIPIDEDPKGIQEE